MAKQKKRCPNGHCICDRLDKGNWQSANEEDRKHGIEMTYHGKEPSNPEGEGVA